MLFCIGDAMALPNCPLTVPKIPTLQLPSIPQIPVPTIPSLPTLPTLPNLSIGGLLDKVKNLGCPRRYACPYYSSSCPFNYTDRKPLS